MNNQGFGKHFLIFYFLLLIFLFGTPSDIRGQDQTIISDAVKVGLDQKLPIDPRIIFGALDNGLSYYIRENQRPENRVELRLVVDIGSVVEDDGQQGLAHFTEHMAFNGTEHFKRQDLVDYLESIGMRFGPDLNAYTSFDETVYMLMVPTDKEEVLETAFQILKDWAQNLLFEHEEIDKERGVVIEEWRLGRGASARMRDKQFPVIFKGSRYAERLPIGKREILESFDYEEVKRFYRDWYRPDLMAVIAVGDIDKSHMEELIIKYFGAIPRVSNSRPRTVFEVPDHDETLFAIATDKEATRTSVSVYYKQPLRDNSTLGAYRQSIVERLYNSIFNYRLYELTQQSEPPFLSASSGQGLFIRSGEVYFLGASVEDESIERGLEAVLTEAERISRYGLTVTELERQKLSVLRFMERTYTEREKLNSSAFAAEYIRSFLHGEPIPGIEYEYELFKRFVPEITLNEINRLSKEWITDRNRVILVNAPEKVDLVTPAEKDLLNVFETIKSKEIAPYEDSVTDQPLVEKAPNPGKIVDENFIHDAGITEWKLSNGTRVILKPTDFKEDEIVFQAFSPGGSSLSNDEDYIPSSTASQVVAAGGIGSFNAVNLQKKLAGKIAHVSPRISSLEEGLSGSASTRDVELLFQLIYLVFTEPRADEIVFNSIQTRMKASLENRNASPMAAYRDTLQATLTQNHYRSRPFTTKLVDEMDLQKSYAFYKERFAEAGDFTFLFVGNLDLDTIRPLVERYIGGLPSIGRKESWMDVGIDYPKGVIRKKVRKGVEPQSQTNIVFTGTFEFALDNANVHSIRSMTAVLQIKLRELLREELGGTYGASVRHSIYRRPDQEYRITIGFGSDPSRVEELIQVIFEEIETLKNSVVSEEYINKVREAQRRSWETNLKQNGYWLSQLTDKYRRGADPSEILIYDKLIEKLDSFIIQEAARKYFDTGNYIQVSLFPETDF